MPQLPERDLIERIRRIQALLNPQLVSRPNVQVPPPAASPELLRPTAAATVEEPQAAPPALDPRVSQIEQLRQEAARMGTRERLPLGQSMLRALAEGLVYGQHPQGVYGGMEQAEARKRQGIQDRLAQAKELRGEMDTETARRMQIEQNERQTAAQQEQLRLQSRSANLAEEQFRRVKEIQDRPPAARNPITVDVVRDGKIFRQYIDPSDTSKVLNEIEVGPAPPQAAPRPGVDIPFPSDVEAQKLRLTRDGQTQEPTGPSPYSRERATRTIQSVNELLKKVTPWTTGVGSLLSALPATQATNFAAELDTLKANIAFNELTAMREASKTGGALGQVSNIELGLLESALGALNTRQSPRNFINQLHKIKASIERWSAAAGGSATPSAPTARTDKDTVTELERGPDGKLRPKGGK